jgi:hypothetical protein
MPVGLTEQEPHYSNFDHTLDESAEELLREGKTLMQHAAWNFCGWVWFKDGMFYEAIMQYRVLMETLSDPTLMEVIRKANEKYGSE